MNHRILVIENHEDETPIWRHSTPTELEALSHTVPHGDPEPSFLDTFWHRERVVNAVEKLEPLKRRIVELSFYGVRASVRRIAAEITMEMQGLAWDQPELIDPDGPSISKSQIFRLQREALNELQDLLTDSPG